MDPVMGISISREGRVFSVHLSSGEGAAEEGGAGVLAPASGESHDRDGAPAAPDSLHTAILPPPSPSASATTSPHIGSRKASKKSGKAGKAKEKSQKSKKKKNRAGKELLEEDSASTEEARETSDKGEGSERKKSGIRTISVREWLRRG